MLYFAFGSNLDVAQMKRRCRSPRVLGRARLPGYALTFAGDSLRWGGGGVANVVPTRGANVEGVIYDLSARDVARLDAYEGCPHTYVQTKARVVSDAGVRRRVFLYAMRHGTWRAPRKPYFDVLARAYERWNLDLDSLQAAAQGSADIAAGSSAPPRSPSNLDALQTKRGTRVFVYGSLLRGEHNHHLLSMTPRVAMTRTVAAYQLFDLGSYPAMVAGGTTAVDGEVYEVDDDTLAHLDRLEGHPRMYCRTPVELQQGAPAWAYLMPLNKVVGSPRVDSGSWRNHLANRKG